MEELPLIFMIIVGGILLGLACNAISTVVEEKTDSSQTALSSVDASPKEAPAAALSESNTKDCKSCGGHSQAGRLCSFCGRVL